MTIKPLMYLLYCTIFIFFNTHVRAQVEDPDAKFNSKKERFFYEGYKFKDTFVFEDVRAFIGTNAFVKLNEKWGLLNQTGKLIFPNSFNEIIEINDKYCFVKNDSGWAIFDRQELGTNTEFIFKSLEYINDRCIIFKKNDLYGFINILGIQICPPIFESIFSMTKSIGFGKCNGLWALIDSNGKQITNFVFSSAKEIVANNILVHNGTKWFLINNKGRTLISPEKGFDEVENFSDGRAIVKNNDSRIYLDTNGKVVSLKKKYADIGTIKNNYCWVFINKKKGWILYNTKTNTEFTFKYVIEDGRPVVDNIGWASLSEKWAMINGIGVLKTPFIFERMVSSGIIGAVWVDTNGSGWVLINDEGTYFYKVPKVFKEVRLYIDNIAEVNDGFGWGLVNASGKNLIPCLFDNITNFKTGKGFVQLNNKWALATQKGKLIKSKVKKTKSSKDED